jgi:hypothetical protein
MAANSLESARNKGALTLNDLADLEERFGSLADMDFTRFAVLRSILWMSVRKTEPDVTEQEIGDRFTIANIATEVQPILVASGLSAGEDDAAGKAAAV